MPFQLTIVHLHYAILNLFYLFLFTQWLNKSQLNHFDDDNEDEMLNFRGRKKNP